MEEKSQNLDQSPRASVPAPLEEPIVMTSAIGTIEKGNKVSSGTTDTSSIRKA